MTKTEGGNGGMVASAKLSPEQILGWLRVQEFNKETEHALLNHPIVMAAADGVQHRMTVKTKTELSRTESDLNKKREARTQGTGEGTSDTL